MLTPETQARLAQLRQKAPDEYTREECIEVVRLLRGDRMNAAQASASSKTKKAKAEIKSADEMLDELSGI